MKISSKANTIISITLLWLCTLSPISAMADESVNIDPYQHINQYIFSFNQSLDEYIARPVAQMYVAVTPDFVERGIANMFDNLNEVTNVFNDLLQGKFSQATNDIGRFGINSTLGIAGLFDIASLLSLKKSDGEDFGPVSYTHLRAPRDA